MLSLTLKHFNLLFFFCSFRCGIEYHAPTDCDVIKKWLTKCADDSETANYISAHTKDVSVALYTDLFCNGFSVLFTFYIFHKHLFASGNISVSVWCVFFICFLIVIVFFIYRLVLSCWSFSPFCQLSFS